MKKNSRKIIYIGINYHLIPSPIINKQTYIAFQQALINSGLEFSKTDYLENNFTVLRESPSPLQIQVISHKGQPLGQIIIIAPSLKTSISLFIDEANAAVESFRNIWPKSTKQIIGGDATIRELCEISSGQHAFKELWEKRLRQDSNALRVFHRPIRGGGLRFILEDKANGNDHNNIEIKIESFIQDTSKIFVETQFAWRYETPQSEFDITNKINDMNKFIENEVYSFLEGEYGNDNQQ